MSTPSFLWRSRLLERFGENLLRIPHSLVEFDLLTDSLYEQFPPDVATSLLDAELDPQEFIKKALKELFGLTFAIPSARGRLAEALLFSRIVEPGQCVASNGLFPTTNAHIQFNGGNVEEFLTEAAFDPQSQHPFKANFDLESLADAVRQKRVSLIAIELCNNALGGQSISLTNLLGVREIADAGGVPLYIDACRVFENAATIAEQETTGRGIWEIVLEICSLADCCTFSAAKGLPLSVGGFLAVRNEELYWQLVDLSTAFGAQLSFQDGLRFAQVLSHPQEIVSGVLQKRENVRSLSEVLRTHLPIVEPSFGHGVFLDLAEVAVRGQTTEDRARSFLRYLFVRGGVRGGINFSTPSQRARSQQFLRFAVPLTLNKAVLPSIAEAIMTALDEIEDIPQTELVKRPPCICGEREASFRLVDNENARWIHEA